MRKHLLICMSFIVSAWLMACHSEKMDFSAKSEDVGKLELKALTVSVDVSDIPLVPHSRVSAPTSYDDFTINIYNSNNEKKYTYIYKDMPDVLELAVGKYTIEAVSSAKIESGFDKPYFAGSATCEITKDVITTVSKIECSLANIQVSATYSDEMKSYMGDDVQVEMWIDESDKITFTPDETRECFLVAPAETGNALKVRFSGTFDGEKISKQLVFNEGVDAGTWQQVNFNVKIVTEGTISSTVNIVADKTTIRNDETIITLPTEDKISDFEDGNTPAPSGEITITGASYAGSSFNIDETQYLTSGSTQDVEIIVNIAASAGIEKLVVRISSDNEDFAAIAAQLGEFDIADEESLGEKKEMLVTLGLLEEGQQIKGSTNVDFEITKATHLLSGFDGTHTFTITVTDANGKSLEKSLIIKVGK